MKRELCAAFRNVSFLSKIVAHNALKIANGRRCDSSVMRLLSGGQVGICNSVTLKQGVDCPLMFKTGNGRRVFSGAPFRDLNL